MNIGGILFFLAIPMVFLVTLIQLIYIYKNRLKVKGKYNVINYFGIFCIFIIFVASGAAILFAISGMPPFCKGTGCQAVGYLYMFATPFMIVGLLVTEIIYSLCSPIIDGIEP